MLTRPNQNEGLRFTFQDGFRFGCGFWAAGFAFSLVFLPALAIFIVFALTAISYMTVP